MGGAKKLLSRSCYSGSRGPGLVGRAQWALETASDTVLIASLRRWLVAPRSWVSNEHDCTGQMSNVYHLSLPLSSNKSRRVWPSTAETLWDPHARHSFIGPLAGRVGPLGFRSTLTLQLSFSGAGPVRLDWTGQGLRHSCEVGRN